MIFSVSHDCDQYDFVCIACDQYDFVCIACDQYDFVSITVDQYILLSVSHVISMILQLQIFAWTESTLCCTLNT